MSKRRMAHPVEMKSVGELTTFGAEHWAPVVERLLAEGYGAKPRSTEEADFEKWQQVRWDKHGWCCFHVDDSRRVGKGRKGFPDRVAVHPETLRFVVIENKRQRGWVKPEQWIWLRLFMAVGAEVYVARPDDKAELELILAPEFDPLDLAVVQAMRCWKEAELGRKPRRGE